MADSTNISDKARDYLTDAQCKWLGGELTSLTTAGIEQTVRHLFGDAVADAALAAASKVKPPAAIYNHSFLCLC